VDWSCDIPVCHLLFSFLTLLILRRPYGLPVPYRQFQNKFSAILQSHNGRPHWAKEHGLRPKEVEGMYPKFADFKRVINRVDPEGILRSEYVRRHLDGEDIADRVFKKRPM
jgi:L-gulonolactone oxidase